MAPSGRPGLSRYPAESAREERQRGQEAGGLGEDGVVPRSTPSEKESGFQARLPETRGSRRPLARISCAWKLFREIYFVTGVFFKAPLYVYALNICLEKNTALPPRLSCPKHRSKPGLKSSPVKSYKSSLIINLQRRGSFLFRIYLS